MERRVVVYKGITFHKYEIDEDGSIYRVGATQPLQPWDDQRGYLKVDLMSDNNIKIGVKIHLAMAHTFIGPQLDGNIVEHIDGNKHNNKRANLEYTSQRENVKRAQMLIKNKEYIDEDKAKNIMNDLKSGMSIVDASKKYSVNTWVIRDMKNSKTYTHYKY
ncbi:MAG: HNH endonuclease [Peptostreptococcaceae bacterium]